MKEKDLHGAGDLQTTIFEFFYQIRVKSPLNYLLLSNSLCLLQLEIH